MSLILTGNQANVTSALSATVTALANNGSGAIRATTSGPHLFGSNDRVYMNVSPAAVGLFNITVIDSTHFDLQGSTFTATGTGTATDLSLTPQIQVPTDGDTFSAQLSGMLSGLQGVLDRTQALRASVGQYKIVNSLILQVADAAVGGTTVWGSGNVTGTQAWTNTGVINPSNTPTVFVGDLITANLSSTGMTNPDSVGGHSVQFSLGFNITPPGSGVGSPSKIAGSGQTVWVDASKTTYSPISLLGIIPAAAATGALRIYGAVSGFVNGTIVANFIGDWTLDVQVWRATTMPAGG